MNAKKTLRELFSEPGAGGTLSWGRVSSGLCLMAAIAWVTRLILITHTLPDFAGLTGFVTAPYAANKMAAAAQAFSKDKEDTSKL